MRTVKFKDLPEKVQVFLQREYAFAFILSDSVELDWLHKINEWRKATDKERLAYAEWKYPKGTIFKPVIPNYKNDATGVIDSFHILYNGLASNLNWVYTENKWAEIIEEVNVDFNPKSGHWLGEPTFKAGDEVEYRGSTISKVVHVFDGMAWIKNADQKYGSLVDLSNLRKPDPDRVYRDIAKEMIERYVNQINKHNHNEHIFVDNDCENMLIEAIKKCKEL